MAKLYTSDVEERGCLKTSFYHVEICLVSFLSCINSCFVSSHQQYLGTPVMTNLLVACVVWRKIFLVVFLSFRFHRIKARYFSLLSYSIISHYSITFPLFYFVSIVNQIAFVPLIPNQYI